VEPPPLLQNREAEMRMTEVALGHLPGEMAGAVVELRREAVDLVARQQQLRAELSRVGPQAWWVEERAARALERGEEILARQILAQGMCTLKTREALQEDLADVRRRVLELLAAIVRAENRFWRSRAQPGAEVANGGGSC
jgi:phage shock protein A